MVEENDNSSEYELRQVLTVQEPEQLPASAASLPPVDGGRQAWLFMLASYLIETLIWGFPFSFGVLNDYYSTHEPFSEHVAGISAVGTTCSGIMYLGAPIVFAIYRRFPLFLRQSTLYGLPIVVLAIVLSSFATNVWQLILTQGLLYSIGGCLLYYPIYSFIDEWFVRKKGLAFGIMWAGGGSGGFAGPLVLNWGLARYGAKTFLRGWGIALLLLVSPLLFFIKPRVPMSKSYQRPETRLLESYSFVKTRTFWILQTSNIVQGLGYFIPGLYLPAFAHTVNLSTLQASLLVSILNTASVPGIVLLSALSDHTNVTNIIFISAAGSAISVFCFWGLASSFPFLIVFTIFYGFFAGGFSAAYAGMLTELRRVAPRAELGSIVGLIGVGRGIGNVLCGPISELILHGRASEKAQKPKFAYDTSYGSLIIFTGVTAVLTLTPFVIKRLNLM